MLTKKPEKRPSAKEAKGLINKNILKKIFLAPGESKVTFNIQNEVNDIDDVVILNEGKILDNNTDTFWTYLTRKIFEEYVKYKNAVNISIQNNKVMFYWAQLPIPKSPIQYCFYIYFLFNI